ncbi:MAG TPA: response regulator [Arsenicitalea sp.]|jgi:FixJ family two-component response regulator|nr:response regulator [Arsenicitalea sp.]
MQNLPIVSIVDDDAAVRGATARLLRLHGFSVHTFPSGEAFLTSERVEDTSCLITDVRMPGMSGFDLQNRLVDQGNRMPVIFITAYPGQVGEAKSPAADTICLLAKPFDGQHLIKCLQAALGE